MLKLSKCLVDKVTTVRLEGKGNVLFPSCAVYQLPLFLPLSGLCQAKWTSTIFKLRFSPNLTIELTTKPKEAEGQ